jgi:hypothetical protein
MEKVTAEWVYSCDQNMTNPSRNKQAFLGQSACCLELGATELEVRTAWGMLTEQERVAANKVADRVSNKWENEQILQRQKRA